jgi:hypothetical protein
MFWVGGNEFPSSLDNSRSPHGYINQRLQIQFGAPDDDEQYAATKHVEPSINSGIINSITRCILLVISTDSYYDARIHEY